MIPERYITGEILGGPHDGLLIETREDGPCVVLSQVAETREMHAYEWMGSTNPENGRWLWRHLTRVSKPLLLGGGS
jgi:hypothetical protein